jgi:hypothetical protein
MAKADARYSPLSKEMYSAGRAQRWRAQQAGDFSGITDDEVNSWRDRGTDGGRKVSWDE